MSITVATARFKDCFFYASAALVSGVSAGATLTRDYDNFDPSVELSWSGSASAQNIRTPTVNEVGTIYTVLFDGTYYVYQEFVYDTALTITETTANKLGHASGKTLSISASGGILKATPSASITGSAKIRFYSEKD